MKEIFEFPEMHRGWELDETGYVIEEPDGSRWVALTSHGRKYKATVEELNEKIAEYETAIALTREAMKMAGLTS